MDKAHFPLILIAQKHFQNYFLLAKPTQMMTWKIIINTLMCSFEFYLLIKIKFHSKIIWWFLEWWSPWICETIIFIDSNDFANIIMKLTMWHYCNVGSKAFHWRNDNCSIHIKICFSILWKLNHIIISSIFLNYFFCCSLKIEIIFFSMFQNILQGCLLKFTVIETSTISFLEIILIRW